MNLDAFFVFVLFPAVPISLAIAVFLDVRKRDNKDPRYQTLFAFSIVVWIIFILMLVALSIFFMYSYLRYM